MSFSFFSLNVKPNICLLLIDCRNHAKQNGKENSKPRALQYI